MLLMDLGCYVKGGVTWGVAALYGVGQGFSKCASQNSIITITLVLVKKVDIGPHPLNY